MSQTIEATETDFLKSVFIYASESKTWLKEMNLLYFKPLWRLCNVFQIKKSRRNFLDLNSKGSIRIQ